LRQLTDQVDAIFVVGAANSSNSNRLREIGLEAGVPTYLIANGAEIKPEWVEGVETVGITAGASAPEVMVMDAIEALRKFGPVEEVSALPGREENMEFRVPVELLDVKNASKIGKDGRLGHSSLAKADCG
jgi:4-hydroxy-3-methylbut-2-enyl diphosphate reductase